MFLTRNVHRLTRLVANKCLTTAPPLITSRGISRAAMTAVGHPSRHHVLRVVGPAMTSKRFAANSPQIDDELTQFLKSEIELEKGSQPARPLPAVKGWSVATEGSSITFSRKYGSEEVTVRTNINHSVQTSDFGADEDASAGGGADGARVDQISAHMVCRPDFAVEIKKGDKTLGINCSFVDLEDMDDSMAGDDQSQGGQGSGAAAAGDEQPLEDEFQINELSVFEGEFKENSYLVSGDVMDGSMYDLMMDLMHERGVNQEFARALIDYTTAYDHQQYVSLLEQLRDFVAKK